jgi:hypothetical protein
VPRSSPIAVSIVSWDRACALRSMCLSLEKTCSIGLRSGEYLGRKKSFAPALRIARRTALPRWLPRLSMIATSPGERWNQNLADPGQEDLPIDGAIEEAWRGNPALAEGCDEGHGLPAAKRGFPLHAHAARTPSPKRRHVRLGPSFIDKNKTLRIDTPLIFAPLLTPPFDVRPVLLFCACGFFYS